MRGALTSRWILRRKDEVEVAVGDAEAAAEVEVPPTLSEMSGAEEQRRAARRGGETAAPLQH